MINKINEWVCNHLTTFLAFTNVEVLIGLLVAWANDNILIGRLTGLLFLMELIYLVADLFDQRAPKN